MLVVVIDDVPVLHLYGSVAGFGEVVVVCDGDDGLVVCVGEFLEDVEDDAGVFGVEVSGGFVAHDDEWVVDECACDGYALLLSAGEFAGGFECLVLEVEHL